MRPHRSRNVNRLSPSFVGGRGHDTRGSGRDRNHRARGRSLSVPVVVDVEEITRGVQNVTVTTTPDSKADGKTIELKGLSLVGFEEKLHGSSVVNQRRFRAFYGVGPVAVAAICNDLPTIDREHILMALNFLKLYDTEHVNAGRWRMNEKDLRQINRSTVKAIQSLKEKKVVWGDWDDDEIFVVSVDGVHCRVREVRKDPGAKWYSHKSHGAGLAYELAISIRSGNLAWIKGPYPASTHDVTIFRGGDDPNNSLKAKIPDGKRGIADGAYSAETDKISVNRHGQSKNLGKFMGRVKSRHETFNGRLKFFNVLDQAFRHDIKQHQQCFEAVCIAVQYDIENGHPLFEV